MSEPAREAMGPLVACLPDVPERRHMGEFPAHLEVVLAPPEPGPLPDLSAVDLIVPYGWVRRPLLDALGAPGRLRVIQTLSAGVDWLIGRVPEGVMVCNARGVYDEPLAEWVVGAILAFQRGLVRARDAQAEAALGLVRTRRVARSPGGHPGLRLDRAGGRGAPATVRRRHDRRLAHAP